MGKKRTRPKVKAEPEIKAVPAAVPVVDKRIRSSLRVIQRAVENGWDVPLQIIDAVPKVIAKVMLNDNSTFRDRIRAAEVLASLVRDRLNAAVSLDKIERLDGGEATERFVVSPEIEQRAKEIIARRIGGLK